MGQFVGCIRGIKEACLALNFPVVSGNVSLYNETQGRGILPTPTIGGVGLLADFNNSATLAFKASGEAIVVLGDTAGWLGQSAYLATVIGREEGAPPPVDLGAEKRAGDLVRDLIAKGRVTAVHDCSDGGLLVAVAEMAMASGVGATLELSPGGIPPHAFWFGEDQGRYVVTAPALALPEIDAAAKQAGVSVMRLGLTGGEELTLPGERPISVAQLKNRHESWLPDYMAGKK